MEYIGSRRMEKPRQKNGAIEIEYLGKPVLSSNASIGAETGEHRETTERGRWERDDGNGFRHVKE